MKSAQDIIIRPVITEASMAGIEAKRYVFEVAKSATKPEIAAAVTELFKVSVADVNTINMKKKPKRLGVHAGYTGEWKKAIVTLKPDSKTIEFFDGMN
ncbi:MAG: 50S ribosomal protein L23 [Eubacteriales bacterium]